MRCKLRLINDHITYAQTSFFWIDERVYLELKLRAPTKRVVVSTSSKFSLGSLSTRAHKSSFFFLFVAIRFTIDSFSLQPLGADHFENMIFVFCQWYYIVELETNSAHRPSPIMIHHDSWWMKRSCSVFTTYRIQIQILRSKLKTLWTSTSQRSDEVII